MEIFNKAKKKKDKFGIYVEKNLTLISKQSLTKAKQMEQVTS